MIDQYQKSGPKLDIKLEQTDSAQLVLRIQKLEAIIQKHDGELSFFKREISRMKSELNTLVNFLRKRG